jgi:hypothetical protein
MRAPIRHRRVHPCRTCGQSTHGYANALCGECRELRKAAWKAVTDAVKAGDLVNPGTCVACDQKSDSPLHAHHHKGYARADWLNVLWMCRPCHLQAPAEARVGSEAPGTSQAVSS